MPIASKTQALRLSLACFKGGMAEGGGGSAKGREILRENVSNG